MNEPVGKISEECNMPSQSWDWEGWTRAVEDNGYVREWNNERYSEGYITEEEYDTRNDKIHLSAFLLDKSTDGMTRIDWIIKNGVISLVHGMTELGFVHLGKPLAYRLDGNKIKMRWGVLSGSELIDWLWNNEISNRSEKAGLSVGGQNLKKKCQQQMDGSKKCDIMKTDIWEVAWTPDPANEGAFETFVNKLAKSGKITMAFPLNGDALEYYKTHKSEFEEWKKERIKMEEMKKAEKVSLKPGEQPPKGAKVITGPKGGKYYVPSGEGKDEKKKEEKKPAEMSHTEFTSHVYKRIKANVDVGGEKKALEYIEQEMERNKNDESKMNFLEGAKKKIKGKMTKSKLTEELFLYKCNDGKPEDRKKPDTKSLLAKCPHAQNFLEMSIKSGDNYLNTLETLSKINEDIFQKGAVCKCTVCGFSALTEGRCLEYSCPICGEDMHAMVRPSLKSNYSDGDEKMEDEKDKKEPDYKEEMKKADEKETPPAPEEKEDDEEEELPEELDNKSLTKILKGVLASQKDLKKSLDSTNLLIKDLGALKKDAGMAGVDEDENKIEEGKASSNTPSDGEVAPGTDISNKTKVNLVDAIDLVKKSGGTVFGLEKGSPEIKPISEFSMPGGVKPDQLQKSNDMIGKARKQLEFIKGQSITTDQKQQYPTKLDGDAPAK